MASSPVAVRQFIINKGFIGYKGVSGLQWQNGTSKEDWSGCYVGMNSEQALGYVTFEKGDGVGTLWRCSLVENYNAIAASGGDLADPNVKGEKKADEVKDALKKIGIHVKGLLIEGLGKEKLIYVGPETNSNNEIILWWDLVKRGLLIYEVLRYYKFHKYMCEGWSTKSDGPWQPLNSLPPDPISPVQPPTV